MGKCPLDPYVDLVSLKSWMEHVISRLAIWYLYKQLDPGTQRETQRSFFEEKVVLARISRESIALCLL